MKIWKLETQTPTHKIIRLNCEEHSDLKFLGDLSDAEILEFFYELSEEIDREKNLKLLKYYKYLHLLVKKKTSSFIEETL